jgi:hypothetical protein
MKRIVCFLFAAVLVLGMIGVASADVFDTGTVNIGQTPYNGDTVQLNISIKGIAVPSNDTISSATLTINASNVNAGSDSVDLYLGKNFSLGNLTGDTTTFTDLVSSGVFKTVTNPETLELDITSGQGFLWFNNVTLNSYDLKITYSDPPPSVPEPCTMLLLGSGLVGLGVFRKRFKTA